MMKTTRTESLLLLALIAAPLTACKSSAPPAAEAQQPADAGIETTVAHVQQSTDSLEVPARIQADPSHVVRIFPPLSGRILGLRVLPGQEVRKGDVVAQLQSSDVAAARSDYEKAKIEAMRADRALTRGKLLLQHEVLSQADYYELEATDQSAHSELERSRQRIHELGFSEDSTADEVALRAPISGVVLDIGSAAGEMQRSLDNATPIATIANIDSVWIVGDVFERDLASLKPGREVQVLVPAYPNTTLTGKISNIGNVVDPDTHTLKLRVV
ncbi:MAG TPA: efflux RND transporter periplasmic adaptor subunit, partial [Edaphobacter sp.]